MCVFLLVVGLGIRLCFLIDLLLKCLVLINGWLLLDYWIENLFGQGVDDILINIYYQVYLVECYIVVSCWCDWVMLVSEFVLLGMVGIVLVNCVFFGDKLFLLVYVDNLICFDCCDFFVVYCDCLVYIVLIMMLFEIFDFCFCGIVELDVNGVVQVFYEKVLELFGRLVNVVVYLFELEVLDFLDSLGCFDIDFSIEVILYYLGRIVIFINYVYYCDIGIVQSWIQVQQDFYMFLVQFGNV